MTPLALLEVAVPAPPTGVMALLALSLIPLLAVVMTAFTKASILLGALRGGLSQPGVLPAVVTTGVAALLTAWVMRPVAEEAYAAAGPVDLSTLQGVTGGAARAWPVVERFLIAQTREADAATVATLSARLAPAQAIRPPDPLDRALAFTLSELRAAFEMAALLLLPFVLIDLLVANVLLIAGLNLTSPALIAFPLKLLLFAAADGWALLARGLAMSYAG
ncbi:EscR/YscR/HrcR family type III secretion system export apparatus protein [Myxococcota bacterium]|nr:EscR/YscR/HrcR family type III secretion system export apparatus protein [Myxococcota bacterium]MBU1432487.1 EscR/YscR/HrcR family type III secretion system export apparatus protein [Myxococcota bacterium]MBU1899647.1 EscR/YscR/HrcR family type III secretion system export apparatus protein [Myxococcota bacterium]